jgi:hypothetical protein
VGEFQAPFPFTGKLDSVRYELKDDQQTDTRGEARAALSQQ